MKSFSLLLLAHVFLLSAAFLFAARPEPQVGTGSENGPGFRFGFGGFRIPRAPLESQMDAWYQRGPGFGYMGPGFENGAGVGFMGPGGGFGVPRARFRPQMDTGYENAPDFGFMGPGGGFDMPGPGDLSSGSLVCEMEGPCYKKTLTCPDKCFSSFSKGGRGFGYGGAQGGCNFDCSKTCTASC